MYEGDLSPKQTTEPENQRAAQRFSSNSPSELRGALVFGRNEVVC